MDEMKALLTEISLVNSFVELKRLHEKLERQMNEQLKRYDSMEELVYSLSEVHDALVKKTLYFAECETVQSAVGERPKTWCWFVMGSMGRREATIWADQDNGILFDCEQGKEQKCYAYIQQFAAVGTKYLQAVGYPFCPGNVMATNPRWSNSLQDWRTKICNYLAGHLPNDIRFLLMAVDMRPIYGELRLVEEEKQRMTEWIYQRPIILKRVGEHSLFPKIPLGLFGHFLEERYGPYYGQFNLKHSGYVQLINCVKFLSLLENITADTTLERIEKLKGSIPRSLLEDTKQAFLQCLYFRLKHAAQYGQHDHYIHLQKLNKEEQWKLKKAMKTTKKLQRFVLKKAGGMKDV
jgi:CBS domain-containing protein